MEKKNYRIALANNLIISLLKFFVNSTLLYYGSLYALP